MCWCTDQNKGRQGISTPKGSLRKTRSEVEEKKTVKGKYQSPGDLLLITGRVEVERGTTTRPPHHQAIEAP
jgi:hypothetical protein